ncbi:hypothetical protein ABT404_06465 [Streptomyces hyaluromycini]|uniref:Uncharacterized protein n=1 Tax=Streptomyces hyaluromycini TaxID=1377993 RepID=A0ABV1WRS7_9ACTN
MNTHPDRPSREDGGGSNDPEQLLDQLLAHHRTQLTNTVAEALDTDTGNAALAPLRRELFHGLKPLKLTAPIASPPAGSTTRSTAPLPAARLQEILTRLRDFRLIVERTCTGTDVPVDVCLRAQTVLTALQRLHAGLQAHNLAHGQVRVLFAHLREQSAHIGTAMLQRRTQLPRHTIEEWLRVTGSLRGIERTALSLFRDAGDNVATQG